MECTSAKRRPGLRGFAASRLTLNEPQLESSMCCFMLVHSFWVTRHDLIVSDQLGDLILPRQICSNTTVNNRSESRLRRYKNERTHTHTHRALCFAIGSLLAMTRLNVYGSFTVWENHGTVLGISGLKRH